MLNAFENLASKLTTIWLQSKSAAAVSAARKASSTTAMIYKIKNTAAIVKNIEIKPMLA